MPDSKSADTKSVVETGATASSDGDRSGFTPVIPAGERVIRANSDTTPFVTAAKDFAEGWQKFNLWHTLGKLELKRRYRRTKLGPFWGAAQNAVYIICVGYIFSTLLSSDRDKYMPFLTTGIIAWMFVYNTMQEASTAFISTSGLRQQLPFPYSMFIYQTIWRNLLVHFHNYILYLAVIIIFPVKVDWHLILLIPGYFLVVGNLVWIATLIATAAARYRDITQLVAAVIQTMIFVTPIFYDASRLNDFQRTWLLPPNLLYHMAVVLRAPLLGETPPMSSYAILFGTMIVGTLIAARYFGKRRNKIIYWIM